MVAHQHYPKTRARQPTVTQCLHDDSEVLKILFLVSPWFDQELKDARKAREALKANPDATQDDIRTADRKCRSLRRNKEKMWAFNNVPREVLWPPADSARISGWLRKRLQRQYELQSVAVEGLDWVLNLHQLTLAPRPRGMSCWSEACCPCLFSALCLLACQRVLSFLASRGHHVSANVSVTSRHVSQLFCRMAAGMQLHWQAAMLMTHGDEPITTNHVMRMTATSSFISVLARALDL